MSDWTSFQDRRRTGLTAAVRAVLADGRPRCSADVVALVSPAHCPKHVIAVLHYMARRGILRKEWRPRPGQSRRISWFHLYQTYTPRRARPVVQTCREPSTADRVVAFITDHAPATIRAVSDALGVSYDTAKAAVARLRRQGKLRQHRDGRRVTYMPPDVAPTVLERRIPRRVLTPTKQRPGADDDTWTPRPWVHPIRARALGRAA